MKLKDRSKALQIKACAHLTASNSYALTTSQVRRAARRVSRFKPKGGLLWRRFTSAAFSLAFLFLLGAEARAQYARPPSDPPTDSDLLTYDGQEKTVIVQIVNATPYDIYLKDTHLLPAPFSTPPPPLTSSSITAADQTEMLDRDRHYTKSFMFAPTGIPWYIPGTPLEAFNNPDENYRNTFTKPFTTVFSWDDHDGVIADNWVNWTVKQVEYCTAGYSDENNKWICTETKHGDVDLGLWMYRIEEHPEKVDSLFFPAFIHDFLAEAFALVGIITDPLNIISWLAMIQATKDLAVGTTEFMEDNTQESPGNKLYLASYVIPAASSFCSQVSQTGTADCSPALMSLRRTTCTASGCTTTDKTGDAVVSKWEADAAGACLWPGGCTTIGQGPAFAPEAELVVTAHLLRRQPAPECIPDTSNPYSCLLGRLNVFMITIMRPTEFAVAALSDGATVSSTLTSESIADTQTLGASVSDSGDSFDDTDDLETATNDSSDQVTAQRRKIRQFLLQAGAGPIRHTLKQQGLSGLLTLRSVVHDHLNLTQRQQLHQMVSHMLAGDRPTDEERKLVRYITRQFQAQIKSKKTHENSK